MLTRFVPITPSDTGIIDPPTDAVMIVKRGGRATVQFVHNAAPVTLTRLRRGIILPYRLTKILKRKTTAQGFVAFYQGGL